MAGELHQAEAVAARLNALLLAANTAAGTKVFSDRNEAFAREESPALLIELVSDLSHPHGAGRDVSELTFAVICMARSEDWRTDVNALRLQAHQAIVADAPLAHLLDGLLR